MMKLPERSFSALLTVMLLALAAGNVLAQESTASSETPGGLTVGILLVGLLAVLAIGVITASKENAEDGNE